MRRSIAQAAVAKDRPEKPYEVRAATPQGLLLRVQPSGARTFYVQVGRGKRVKIGPAGVFTLQAAKERAKRILLDPEAAIEKRAEARAQTLAEYLRDIYEPHALARQKNGAKTIARIRAVWAPLLKRRLTSITATEVEKLGNKRILAGVSPATINRDVAALSGLLTHWVDHGGGKAHPLAGMEARKVADDEVIRYLDPDEAKRLRQALADRDAEISAARARANEWRGQRGYERMPEISGYADHITPMVLLSLNTGIRQGELFSLTWQQVDMQRRTLTVLASHAKGNATRTIPLNAEAFDVLQRIRPAQAAGLVFKSPVTGERFNNVKKAWAEVTKAAGLDGLRWHDLRHDFASQLVMRGVSLFTVQKLLGHSTPKMTMRYAKLAPGVLADAVAALETAA